MNRALSMISLAAKAGKTKSGEFMTEKEVKEGRAHLVIVADDASDNTKKKFQNVIVTVMNLITSSEKILKMLA